MMLHHGNTTLCKCFAVITKHKTGLMNLHTMKQLSGRGTGGWPQDFQEASYPFSLLEPIRVWLWHAS